MDQDTNFLFSVIGFEFDRDKSQGKRIQSTELVISDGIAKRDGLNGLTVKELIEGNHVLDGKAERRSDSL